MRRGLHSLAVIVLVVTAGCAALTPGPDGPTGREAVEVTVLEGSRGGDVHPYPTVEANTTAATLTVGTPDDTVPWPHLYFVVNHANATRSVHVVVRDGATRLNARVTLESGEILEIQLSDPGNYRTTLTVRADSRVLSTVRVREYASNFNCNAKYLSLALNGNGTVASGVVSTSADC